jgi:hypothetical protein
VIPYAEKILSDHLRTDADLVAMGARVVGKTPSTTAEPWVRVTQLDAQDIPSSDSEHLIDFLVQFDCYAGSDGGQPEANLLARTVRESLREARDATHSGAVVTRARIVGHLRLPDQDFEPARERFVLTAAVHIHNT